MTCAHQPLLLQASRIEEGDKVIRDSHVQVDVTETFEQLHSAWTACCFH